MYKYMVVTRTIVSELDRFVYYCENVIGNCSYWSVNIHNILTLWIHFQIEYFEILLWCKY